MAYITFLLATFIIPIVLGSIPHGKLNLIKIAEEINADTKSTFEADNYDYDIIDIEEFSKTRLGLRLPADFEDIAKNFNRSGKNPFFTEPSRDIDPKVGASIFFPKFYDARKQYPECKSIGLIRDQSNCGSCWAVSAASVFSDRICIHSNAKYNFSLSAQFTTSCSKENFGCHGGLLAKVWEFYKKTGCVTGGEYESDEGCQPYEIKPCGRFPRKYPCAAPVSLTPKCRKACTNEWYEHKYEKNIFKVKKYYQVGDFIFTLFNEFLIQQEIVTNGPVQAGFLVYPDFIVYKSGIYNHQTPIWKDYKEILGQHAVKIIGWGEEKGVKYWIVSNSWTEEWGEKGTFRIIRGENNVFIEGQVYAGIPNI